MRGFFLYIWRDMLSGSEIKKRIESGAIVIDPFDLSRTGPNSYDVRLAPTLYQVTSDIIDPARPVEIKVLRLAPSLILMPGELYLGATIEYTETWDTVPKLDGKSSVARLGVCVHQTAGFGDVGFCGHWTLEITVTKPTVLYAEMPIAQIYYEQIVGEIDLLYSKRKESKYNNKRSDDPLPNISKMYKIS